MVRSIEAMGSSSGKTRQHVAIANCGELPSRRQILAKMAAEKEALANMKKDPLQVSVRLHHESARWASLRMRVEHLQSCL